MSTGFKYPHVISFFLSPTGVLLHTPYTLAEPVPSYAFRTFASGLNDKFYGESLSN